MSEYTKGPWKLLRFDKREEYVVTTESGERDFHRAIASLPFGYLEPVEKEQHANARLIAAAPQMLGALKFIVTQLQDPANAHYTLADYCRGIGLENGIKAIAAAEGKS